MLLETKDKCRFCKWLLLVILSFSLFPTCNARFFCARQAHARKLHHGTATLVSRTNCPFLTEYYEYYCCSTYSNPCFGRRHCCVAKKGVGRQQQDAFCSRRFLLLDSHLCGYKDVTCSHIIIPGMRNFQKTSTHRFWNFFGIQLFRMLHHSRVVPKRIKLDQKPIIGSSVCGSTNIHLVEFVRLYDGHSKPWYRTILDAVQ